MKSELTSFAGKQGVNLKPQKVIVEEARNNITKKYGYSTEEIKNNFDNLLEETEKEAYRLYLKYEKEYGRKVFSLLVDDLKKRGRIKNIEDVGEAIGDSFNLLDRFFLSISQSRRTRAGKAFEKIHNTLFKALDYPFDEQVVINGKPDFLMPSANHYKINPMDCIIFTAKRTLRERWRQIVTEGTRGLGFYLATIDKKVSSNQLAEMLIHRIYLVCPANIKKEFYNDKVNVLNFTQVFKDHLDPKVKSWKRNKII